MPVDTTQMKKLYQDMLKPTGNTPVANKGYNLVPKEGGGETVVIPAKGGGTYILEGLAPNGQPMYKWLPPEGYEQISDPKSIAAYDKVVKNPKGQDMWGVPKGNAGEIMESLKFKPPASYYSQIPNVEAIKNYSKVTKDPESSALYGIPLPATSIPTISWEEAKARNMETLGDDYTSWVNYWVRDNFFQNISRTKNPETGQEMRVGNVSGLAPGYGGSLKGQSLNGNNGPSWEEKKAYWKKLLQSIEKYKIAHGQPLPSEDMRGGAWSPEKPPTY